MRQTTRRRAAAGLVASFSLLLPTALPALAASPSGEIMLDGATSAEGIAAGEGKTFYAGELSTGDIFRGDIRKDTATRFIDAPAGRAAAGMKADTCHHLLFVAGAATGKAFVYNTETGKPVADFDLAKGFINDVTLTSDGAWFTNSAAAELYFLPGTVRLGAGGDYRLDWDSKPEILLDLELKPDGVTIYAKLSLADVQAGIEINHITFHRPSVDADTDTAFLAKTLSEARFVVKSDQPRGSEHSH